MPVRIPDVEEPLALAIAAALDLGACPRIQVSP